MTLDRHLDKNASFLASQGIEYSKNIFTLSVQQLKPSTVAITKGDIARLGLLPSGSKWRQGLGWHSIFGVPFKLNNKHYFAIGAEVIVKHVRGDTHPIFRAYIFEYSQIN